jgi:TPP-dependent pyruvate/acetoin dehydrogenase alpha subunit
MNTLPISLMERMLKVRRFEERVAQLYPEQEMRCPVHLSIGQEATAAGMCEAMAPQDILFSNHRSHGHYLAKGGSMRRLMAELYGKETGCCGGIGGSMHLIDLPSGFIASTPIVGGILPVAAGAALAAQMKGSDQVTVVFLGDGTMEEGVVHETLNIAALKKLPVVFFCENNYFSVYSPMGVRQPTRDIIDLAKGHGVRSHSIDGNDVMTVYKTAKEACEFARSGSGPVFIEAHTYRWLEHCGPYYDNNLGYREEKDFLVWKDKCPIIRHMHDLVKLRGVSEQEIDALQRRIDAEIEDAVVFAKTSPFPSEDRLFMNLFASERQG